MYGTVPYSDPATFFSLPTNGTYTLLHSFNPGTDGSTPNARLAVDHSGNLFGTAPGGDYTLAYNFKSDHDGHCPFSGVAAPVDIFRCSMTSMAPPTGDLVRSHDGTLLGGTAYSPIFKIVPKCYAWNDECSSLRKRTAFLTVG